MRSPLEVSFVALLLLVTGSLLACDSPPTFARDECVVTKLPLGVQISATRGDGTRIEFSRNELVKASTEHTDLFAVFSDDQVYGLEFSCRGIGPMWGKDNVEFQCGSSGPSL